MAATPSDRYRAILERLQSAWLTSFIRLGIFSFGTHADGSVLSSF